MTAPVYALHSNESADEIQKQQHQQQPHKPGRCQANARERYRTQSVNSAFGTLRTMIPTEPLDRKLSKIETLRLAHSYIEHLNALLCTGQLISPCGHRETTASTTRAMASPPRRSNICTFCVAARNAATTTSSARY